MKKRKFLFIFIIFLAICGIATKVQADEELYTIDYGILDTSLSSVAENSEPSLDVSALDTATPTVNSVKKYYYNQLTTKLAKDTYNLLLSDPNGKKSQLTLNLGTSQTLYVGSVTKSNVEKAFEQHVQPYLLDGLMMFIDDNPMIYWWFSPNLSYSYRNKGDSVEIVSFTLISTVQERTKNQSLKNKINTISNSISGSSVYEKAKKIHDYVCKSITYTMIDGTYIDQTVYGAAIGKKCVCEGYAKLFKVLCEKKGLVCIVVSGKAGSTTKGPHQWCYLYHPTEKKWYVVDPTWDDAKSSGVGVVYNYFLVGSDTVVANNNMTLKQNHVNGHKVYKDQTFFPKEPTLSKNAYEQFKITSTISTKNPTNQNVKVTLKSNRRLKAVSGWSLASNKLSITKTYTANKKETVTVTNERGEVIKFGVTVSNIDKTKPVLTTKYSNQNLTNQNVKVTISSTEKLKTIDGWVLSTDKKSLSKIYTQNTTETVKVYDLAGNMSEAKVNISNIDKETATFKMQRSTTQPTNEGVTINIYSSKELKTVTGWEISSDKKQITKKYDANTEEKVILETINGYKYSITVNVKNIDKIAPEASVRYSTKETTNNPVKVEIVSNEQLKPISGWNLSSDKKILSKYFIENTNQNITISDLAGNTKNVEIEITNIDKQKTLFDVSYSQTELTNQDVTVKIEATDNLKELSGWSLSENKKSLTKTYSENTEETVTVETEDGYQENLQIIINQIDKVPPKIEVKYSTLEETTEKVQVQIQSNKELQELDNWDLSEDKKTLSRGYRRNVEEELTVKDLAGNSVNVKISVQNIKQQEHECEVTYQSGTDSEGRKFVTVVIKSEEEMMPKDGWDLSPDKKTMTKTYYENSTDDIEVELENGEKISVVVKVDELKDDDTDNDDNNNDEEFSQDDNKKDFNIDDERFNDDKISDNNFTGVDESNDEENNSNDENENWEQNGDNQDWNTDNNSEWTNNFDSVDEGAQRVTIEKISAESPNLYNGKIIPKLGESGKIVAIVIGTLFGIAIIFFIKYKSYKDVK